MNIHNFVEKFKIDTKTETEKIEYLAYYSSAGDKSFEFTIDDCINWLVSAGFSTPNKSRLRNNLSSKKSVIKGTSTNSLKLHYSKYKELNSTLNLFSSSEENLECTESIIPEALYKNTRKYIELLSKQINASYDNSIFDGCAVLMRRLFEILLIHSYENNKQELFIKDKFGNYKMLFDIVSDAENNSVLNLSRNTKQSLEKIRDTGNYAAHKIFYNTKKTDIDPIKFEYRAVIEELLYKSGIRR